MSLCSVHAEPEAADARALGLFADHEVEAEVLRARAAVGAPARPCRGSRRAPASANTSRGHDPRALPLAVAALLADHLALEERAKARAEVFVDVLEQAALASLDPTARAAALIERQAAARSAQTLRPVG